MHTILSLALAVVMVTGVATFSGCDKGKSGTMKDDKTKVTTPGGGTEKTETKTETETTPPKDHK